MEKHGKQRQTTDKKYSTKQRILSPKQSLMYT